MVESILSFLKLSSMWQLLLLLLGIAALYVPVIIISRKRDYSLVKASMLYFLVIYIMLVFYETVLSRTAMESEVNYLFRPFWSYRLPMKYIRAAIIKEITVNVFMLAPIGVVIPCVAARHRVLLTGLISFAVSLSIELLQLFTKTGFSEFDDIFHNVLGALAVCLIYIAIEKIIIKFRQRKSNI